MRNRLTMTNQDETTEKTEYAKMEAQSIIEALNNAFGECQDDRRSKQEAILTQFYTNDGVERIVAAVEAQRVRSKDSPLDPTQIDRLISGHVFEQLVLAALESRDEDRERPYPELENYLLGLLRAKDKKNNDAVVIHFVEEKSEGDGESRVIAVVTGLVEAKNYDINGAYADSVIRQRERAPVTIFDLIEGHTDESKIYRPGIRDNWLYHVRKIREGGYTGPLPDGIACRKPDDLSYTIYQPEGLPAVRADIKQDLQCELETICFSRKSQGGPRTTGRGSKQEFSEFSVITDIIGKQVRDNLANH